MASGDSSLSFHAGVPHSRSTPPGLDSVGLASVASWQNEFTLEPSLKHRLWAGSAQQMQQQPQQQQQQQPHQHLQLLRPAWEDAKLPAMRDDLTLFLRTRLREQQRKQEDADLRQSQLEQKPQQLQAFQQLQQSESEPTIWRDYIPAPSTNRTASDLALSSPLATSMAQPKQAPAATWQGARSLPATHYIGQVVRAEATAPASPPLPMKLLRPSLSFAHSSSCTCTEANSDDGDSSSSPCTPMFKLDDARLQSFGNDWMAPPPPVPMATGSVPGPVPVPAAAATPSTTCSSVHSGNSGIINFLSVGSLEHGSGCCRPCDFAARGVICRAGVECKFCHLCGPQERRQHRNQRRKELRQNLRQAFSLARRNAAGAKRAGVMSY